jgi:hypothetical protein
MSDHISGPRALAEPVADMLRPMRYVEMFPPPQEDYRPVAATRTGFSDAVDGRLAQSILDHLEASTAMMAAVQLRPLGGAMARVPADATAFAHRERRLMFNTVAMVASPDEVEAHAPAVHALAGELAGGIDGAYTGFLGDEGADRIRAAYPGATYDRLAAVKATYDPENLLRLNQNVPPA